MRKILSEVAEAIIVGVLMAVLMRIIGIEAAAWQYAAIGGGAILSVAIAGTVRKAIATGEPLYNYEYVYQYGENVIAVKAGKKEELYINGKLADEKSGISFRKVELKGLLDTGEKITAVLSPEKVRKQIFTDMYLHCELLIDGKPLQQTQ